MEEKEEELNDDDLSYLTKELKSYKNGAIYLVIFLALLYYGFYYLNFHYKPTGFFNGIDVVFELIVLGFLTYIGIKGIERNKNFKKNIFKQKVIVGDFKVLEKEITNKNDADEWSHYVIRIFSKIENKDKYIFLNGSDFRKINEEEYIYIEYFTDSNLIKILNYKNKKLEYTRYGIYDNKWG